MTELRILDNADLDKAYDIICWRFDYLQAKGIQQYLEPFPTLEIYQKRQYDRLNFGLYISGTLNGIVTLIDTFPLEWKEISLSGQPLWICSLFTSKEAMGQMIGSIFIEKIENYARSINKDYLILDCFIDDTEFLVNYYQKAGFQELRRKVVEYPNRQFDAAFMYKDLNINRN